MIVFFYFRASNAYLRLITSNTRVALRNVSRKHYIDLRSAILQRWLEIYIRIHMMETGKDYRDVTGSIDFKRDC